MSAKRIEPIGVPEWGVDRKILRPMQETTKAQWITFAVLVVFFLWGVVSVGLQMVRGLGITGLGKPLYWGFYITHFVFFIGISHAGTLVSAILRLNNAEWRRPITRIAEAITAFALIIGASQVIIDMGRMDRILNIILYPQPKSPLFWDVCSITLYLSASLVYLYVPMIPDLAMCREEYRAAAGWRYKFYKFLSMDWQGGERATRRLHRVINFLMIIIIPIAISVHTVISWIFSMTIQPMWHSTIFGPYFVVGAIYSGIGALMIVMAVIRRVFDLKEYFKPIHFKNLGLLLLVMTCLWFYFTFAEYLTIFYGDDPHEMAIFVLKMTEYYAFEFWLMISCMVGAFIILAVPYFRTITGFALSGILINIGMWLERYIIVTPTLSRPRLSYETAYYLPSFWEWGEFIGSIAAFLMLYWLFAKLFPLLSVWEIKEGRERAIPEVIERIKSYAPDTVESENKG